MNYLVLDLRPGKQEFRKTAHLDPVLKALSKQGAIQIVDTVKSKIHVADDAWIDIKEVNER